MITGPSLDTLQEKEALENETQATFSYFKGELRLTQLTCSAHFECIDGVPTLPKHTRGHTTYNPRNASLPTLFCV